MFSTTYGEPTACRFSFVTLLSREISIAEFSRVALVAPTAIASTALRFACSIACVTHRHPNIRPTEDRGQCKASAPASPIRVAALPTDRGMARTTSTQEKRRGFISRAVNLFQSIEEQTPYLLQARIRRRVFLSWPAEFVVKGSFTRIVEHNVVVVVDY